MTFERSARGGGWMAVPLPRPDAGVRLYCIPWAGAGAGAFRSWSAQFPPEVEVVPISLPGRERRLRERPLESVSAIVDELAPALLADADRPYAVFGHSMGALVGYEAVRRLTGLGAPPVRLVVSASRAPHLPLRSPGFHPLPRPEFLEAVRRLQPSPNEALHNEELVDLLLPAMRADFTAAETYLRAADEPLSCPVTALGGSDDPVVAWPDLLAWEKHTTGPFGSFSLSGGHLFVNTAACQVQELIVTALRGDIPATRG